MAVKLALVLMAGPESPCRFQHALLFARDVAQRGGQARIVLEGNAPQWLLEIGNPDHKQHKLFALAQTEGLIAGVCQACARQHGALQAAEALGLTLLSDAYGHASLAPFIADGYALMSL